MNTPALLRLTTVFEPHFGQGQTHLLARDSKHQTMRDLSYSLLPQLPNPVFSNNAVVLVEQ